jgi:prophage tail gpP-like protein
VKTTAANGHIAQAIITNPAHSIGMRSRLVFVKPTATNMRITVKETVPHQTRPRVVARSDEMEARQPARQFNRKRLRQRRKRLQENSRVIESNLKVPQFQGDEQVEVTAILLLASAI